MNGTIVEISLTELQMGESVYVYRIDAGDRQYVIRSVDFRRTSADDTQIGNAELTVNVGQSIKFAPEGIRAYVLVDGKELQFNVLRQLLTSTHPEPPPATAAGPHGGRASPVKAQAQSSSTTGTPPTEVYRVNQGASALTLIYKVEPEYTETARKARAEGTVVLYGAVGSDGRVRNFRVIRGLGYGLDYSAIEAVSKWRFNPGYKDGKPVTVACQFEIKFRLVPARMSETTSREASIAPTG